MIKVYSVYNVCDPHQAIGRCAAVSIWAHSQSVALGSNALASETKRHTDCRLVLGDEATVARSRSDTSANLLEGRSSTISYHR